MRSTFILKKKYDSSAIKGKSVSPRKALRTAIVVGKGMMLK